MSITAGLAATKTGFDLIKSARELLTRSDVNPAEIQGRLLELQALMLEAQRALGDAEEENRQLRHEIQELKQQQQTAEGLTFADEVYWNRDSSNKLFGPFCPTCWDDARKLIRLRLSDESEYAGREGRWRLYQCTLHKVNFFLRPEIFNNTTIR